jgi:RHS repeat-associated protein
MIFKNNYMNQVINKNSKQTSLQIVKKYMLLLMLFVTLFNNSIAQQSKGVTPKSVTGVPFKGTADVTSVINGNTVVESMRLEALAAPNSLSSPLTAPTLPGTTHKKIRNVVILALNESADALKSIPQNFTANVQVKISYGSSATSTLQNHIQDLVVTYDKNAGAKYKAKSYFSFEDAAYVNVTLLSLNAPVLNGFDTRNVLTLENKMDITHYYQLANPVPNPTSLNFTAPATAVPDQLGVSWEWSAATGHNGTQLEWSWVENEMEDYYKTNGTLNFDLVFKEASRVDLDLNRNNYDIPLLYDGVGKLYYRVRAVNFYENGGRVDGPWHVGPNYSFAGHNDKLNWQATTTFAEEGKRKTVIQYFDGSLRGRQTVTKDNSTNTVVVAESFYDSEGRPAIQILPTPSMSGIIQYQAGLNMFNTQTANQDPAEVFDLTPIASQNSLVEPLSTASGSANYYSNANTLANTGSNKNIPDAQGYPYSVTRYTPDATGRILKQSGVGPDHKMGSGHETKYFYGGASQEELNGLFGTEVGNFTHYSKNMVQDANGQMSISYVDMQGRTIATALAGDAPLNLESLNNKNDAANYPGQAGSSITRNLLDDNTNLTNDGKIESITSILVPAQTNYNFKYSLQPQTLQLPNCANSTPATLCYECKYDLEISIVDESGDMDAPVMTRKYTNIALNQTVGDNCSNSTTPITIVSGNNAVITDIKPNDNIEFTQQLPSGSYALRKTLTVNQDWQQKYFEIYAAKSTCVTEKKIIDSVYNVLVSTSNCNATAPVTCQTCNAELGTLSQFQTAYLTAYLGQNYNPADPRITPSLITQIEAAYKERKDICDKFCVDGNTSTSAEIVNLRQLMLLDMVPYTGQYAVKESNKHSTKPLTTNVIYTKYNVFSGVQANTKPFYKYPKNKMGVLDFYKDEVNATDRTIHPEQYENPIMNSYGFLNTIPQDDFVSLFKLSWRESLLPYHPEYNRLVFAETEMVSCFNWTRAFLNVKTVAAAHSLGYLTPLTVDPFVTKVGTSSTYYTDLLSQYNNYELVSPALSMWQRAYGMIVCKTSAQSQIQTCMSAAPNTPPPATGYPGLTAQQNNEIWLAFQGLYLSARMKQMQKYIALQRPLSGGATEEQQLVNEDYRIWFPSSPQQLAQSSNITWWPTTGGPTTSVPGGVTTTPPTASSTCESNIARWKVQLQQCSTLQNHPSRDLIVNTIVNRMVTVCANSLNAANPYGASNIPVGIATSVTDRSFEQIIGEVYAQYGWATLVNGKYVFSNEFCNPFVIEWPKPYGKGPKITENPKVSLIEKCNCEQYEKIKQEATLANVNVNNLTAFNAYLLQEHGETLTEVMYNGLNNGCSKITGPACECNILEDRNDIYNNTTAPNNVVLGSSNNTILCKVDFLNFYNSTTTGTDFATYEALENHYYATCGHPPFVCGINYFTQDQLYTVICKFRGAYYFNNGRTTSGNSTLNSNVTENKPPSSNDCIPDFITFFNQYFKLSTAYDFTQILNVYSNVFGPSLNLADAICGAVPSYCSGQIATCNATLSVVGLSESTTLPTFLTCGYVSNPKCVSCAKLSELTGEYKMLFNMQQNEAPVFNSNDVTEAQLAANNNYARFLNYRLGYQYSWSKYAEAAQQASPTCNLASYASNTAANQNVICGSAVPLNDTTGFTFTDSLCQRVYTMAVTIGQEIYKQRIESKLADFKSAYAAKCMAVKSAEHFTVQYTNSEYHYTLYYYDRANNLVKTVPPKGVKPNFSKAFTDDVDVKRLAGTDKTPDHEFFTQYRYNSLNQVVAQHTPDANKSTFWYDVLGRLVVSQNAKQAAENNYSYTLYDNLGRIKEVGEKPQTAAMTQAISQDATALNNWLNNTTTGGVKQQITRTTYDDLAQNLLTTDPKLVQRDIRNRVSYVQYFDVDPVTDQYNHTSATYYTYDIHGNVDCLLQDFKGIPGFNTTNDQRFKKITYEYDLISGKVNKVAYQPDLQDAFYHKYEYDAENRLTEVLTSRDKLVWERDARYEYYKHGPMSRTILGQLGVQGTDYAYTIQGWLKGINNSALQASTDVFGDGANSSVIAKDVLSYTLHYFNGDYKPIGHNNTTAYAPFADVLTNTGALGLYNGNIKAMSVHNAGLKLLPAANNNTMPLFYQYSYDQLNRIKTMQTYKGLNEATNQWNPLAINDYNENVSYDPNGNILNYNRNGAPSAGMPQAMDQLAYEYIPNTNKLKRVTDNTALNGNYTVDVDNQSNADNYEYDVIGNLTKDLSEGIDNIKWTVYGKIESIHKNSGADVIKYNYDAAGNRISKTVEKKSGTTVTSSVTTLYVRDASGNVMSVYEQESATAAVVQSEIHIYGSSRIGMHNKQTNVTQQIQMQTNVYGQLSTFTRGEKVYELSNHLGNVLTVITDKKLVATPTNGTQCQNGTAVDILNITQRGTELNYVARQEVNFLPSLFASTSGDFFEAYTNPNLSVCVPNSGTSYPAGSYFTADIVSATDYYPFGMSMPGRSYNNGNDYRYGFNGKEKDKDINSLTAYDYGFRIYNPAIGKFLSVDPLTESYPFYTPYQFAGNIPISCIDLEGAEPKWMVNEAGKFTKPIIALYSAAFNYKAARMSMIEFKHYNWTKYMVQTEYLHMWYNPKCMNYCENTNPQEYLNIWFNVTVHEAKHKQQFSNFWPYGVVSMLGYLFAGAIWDIWDGDGNLDGYSRKSPWEVNTYGIEPEIKTLINMHDGAALKILENDGFDDKVKSEALAYIGAEYQANKANKKSADFKNSAAADGNISRREQRKINKFEKIAKRLKNKADALKTETVVATLNTVSNMPSRSIDDYNSTKYDENKANVKKENKEARKKAKSKSNE